MDCQFKLSRTRDPLVCDIRYPLLIKKSTFNVTLPPGIRIFESKNLYAPH